MITGDHRLQRLHHSGKFLRCRRHPFFLRDTNIHRTGGLLCPPVDPRGPLARSPSAPAIDQLPRFFGILLAHPRAVPRPSKTEKILSLLTGLGTREAAASTTGDGPSEEDSEEGEVTAWLLPASAGQTREDPGAPATRCAGELISSEAIPVRGTERRPYFWTICEAGEIRPWGGVAAQTQKPDITEETGRYLIALFFSLDMDYLSMG